MEILSKRARSRTLLVLALVLGLSLLAAFALAATPGEMDLTTTDATADGPDGAILYQGPLSAGTGNFDPFLTVDNKGNATTEKGYNTTPDVNKEFDVVKGGNGDSERTHELLLSAVPVQVVGDVAYREFVLDANEQATEAKKWISIDEIKIFLADRPDVSNYDETNETFSGTKYPIAWGWDIDEDWVVLMRYDLESGSGVADITLLVPDSEFTTPGQDCSYGAPAGETEDSCDSWVVFWSQYGNYTGDAHGRDWGVEAGFEEWGTQLRPIVHVEKTADPAYDVTYDWDLTKTDDGTYDMFAGDTVSHPYTVTATRSEVTGNYELSGTVTIKNPTGDAALSGIRESIAASIHLITDTIHLGPPTGGLDVVVPLSCIPDGQGGFTEGYPSSIGAGETIDCVYTHDLGDEPEFTYGVNTVKVEIFNTKFQSPAAFSATAEFDFIGVLPIIGVGSEPAEITVSDDNFGKEEAGSDPAPNGASGTESPWTYSLEFACPTDPSMYVGGMYSFDPHVNTAIINETDDDATATVTVDCYAPIVSKTAEGDYELGHTWTIDKKYDKDYVMFAGESVIHNYEITLKEKEGEQNFAVTGKISVTNPTGSPGNMVVALADVLDDGTEATIPGCSDGIWDATGETVTVAAGHTAVCDYKALPSDKTAAKNKVTATFAGIDFVDEKVFSWKKTDVGFTEVNITDDYGTAGDVIDDLKFGPFTGDAKPAYPRTFECSADPAMYRDGGSYSYSVTNWAMIDETKAKDDATVNVLCVAPVVTKTAKGNYDEDHQWKIEKGPDGEYWKFAGETATHDYTIKLTETVKDQNFAVTGTISVENPHPTMPMTVTLSDKLDDGTVAKLLCTDDDLVTPGHQVTIAAASTALCGYEAMPGTKTAKNNTAKAVFSGVDYTKTVGFSWTATPTGEPDEVDVIDKADDDTPARTYGPFLTSKSFDTEGSWMCSADPAAYTNGYYSFTVKNTATIKQTDDNDSATVKVNCYAPVVSKTAVPEFTRTYHWDIDKEAFLANGSVVPPEGLDLEYGQSYDLQWKVKVSLEAIPFTDSDWGVNGVITVDNPNPKAVMTVWLSDELDDATVASITECSGGDWNGQSLAIPADGTATCKYEATDIDGDAKSNTVTAMLNKIAFTYTEPFAYKTPTTEVQATVYVTDTFNGGAETPLGTVHYSELSKTFELFTFLSSDRTHNPDVLLVCDANLVVNRAEIWTSGDEARATLGHDIREVPVYVHCADGCTLTQGYWKTHNDSFWGGAPTDATWSELVFYDYYNRVWKLGNQDSPFFQSGQSFFVVMWTPPKGNVYYNLGRQYIAAQLNFLNDADSSAVATEFAAATELFMKYSPEDTAKLKGKKGKELRKEFIDLASVLAKYNEGVIGPGHCDEDLSTDNS